MQCPRLSQLPPPPGRKTGWPWTEETPVSRMIQESEPARISVITPSYNSARYLEETVRSVLLQGYPNLEYILIDGGSADSSVDLIKKYAKWISFWVSEKDRGYADAVNKGFARATGEILAWIPASDLYTPGALHAATRHLQASKADLVYGDSHIIDEEGRFEGVTRSPSRNLKHITLYGRGAPVQCSAFWRKALHHKVGELNANLRCAADSEWFLRLSLAGRGRWIPEIVCSYRRHPGQLSSGIEAGLREGYAAWKEVVRSNRISRARVTLGALFLVPFMRYRSGGWKPLVRLPSRQSLKRLLLNR